jgi:dihydrofolate reductase
MRKIIVSLFITLDGVMQAPGGGEEAFKFGGWSAPYFDEVVDKVLEKQQQKPANLLLGRKTFEMFASFWPEHEDIWPGINDMTKYVMSNTLTTSDWQNSVFLKSLADIETIKKTDGPDLHVSGSGQLIQLLLKNDFVDELWLLIHPVTLGTGKKLFGDGTIPAAFTLTESLVSPTGVIIANYKRAGEVKTGTVGA